MLGDWRWGRVGGEGDRGELLGEYGVALDG